MWSHFSFLPLWNVSSMEMPHEFAGNLLSSHTSVETREHFRGQGTIEVPVLGLSFCHEFHDLFTAGYERWKGSRRCPSSTTPRACTRSSWRTRRTKTRRWKPTTSATRTEASGEPVMKSQVGFFQRFAPVVECGCTSAPWRTSRHPRCVCPNTRRFSPFFKIMQSKKVVVCNTRVRHPIPAWVSCAEGNRRSGWCGLGTKRQEQAVVF